MISWEEALAHDPEDPRALLALGTHLYEQEYLDDARALLKKAVTRDAEEDAEDRRRARMLLAIIEHVSRNFAEAERLVKEALALPPSPEDQPKLLFVLGRTYVSAGREAEAVATLARTLKIISAGTPWAFRYSAVPRVARMWRPISWSSFAWGNTPALSKSFTEMKTFPEVGIVKPAANWAFAKAMAKVDRCPSPRRCSHLRPELGVHAGELGNGKTGSLIDTLVRAALGPSAITCSSGAAAHHPRWPP